MNPRIKRLLSMLLALTMVFSLTAPVSASAASTTAASGNTVEIEVGESKKLSSSGWLSKTTWTSSDETVATVSNNGTVTGVAEGTATITATSKSLFFFFGGSTKTTTYTVVVTEGTPEVPTEPEETEPEEGLTVKAGEQLQLEVNANGGTVTWKSSNKNIATVDNKGLVTGVSEGTVIITATVKKTTGGNGFWFFWWIGGKTTTTTTEFEITVLLGDEQPTEPPVTEPPVTEPPVVTYTVTFESNGGSEVEPQTIEEGQPATEPEAPTMDGYTFAGWYADAELTEVYDFATPITGDITLYAAWDAVPSEPDNVVDEEDTEVSEDDEYILTASEAEVLANSATEVVFYVNSTLTVPYFELYLNGESTGILLYDNGDYSGTGDDIPNDGCYTAVLSLNYADEQTLSYTSSASVGEQVVTTNEYTITIYTELSDEQITAAQKITDEISSIMQETNAQMDSDATEEEKATVRYNAIYPYLEELNASGAITNLEYNDISYVISYVIDGVEYGVMCYDYSASSEEALVAGTSTARDDTFLNSTTSYTAPTLASVDIDLDYITYKEKALVMNYCASDVTSQEDEAGAYWISFNDSVDSLLEGAGFEVENRYEVTIEDFKEMQGYQFISINCHGSYYGGGLFTAKTPVICTEHDVTEANKKTYSADLKAKRICAVTTTDGDNVYWIKPAFFTYYYEENPLDCSIFYVGCCKGAFNETLVDAIETAGADSVVAYSDTVYIGYNMNVLIDVIDSLLTGSTINDAVEDAKNINGADDMVGWGVRVNAADRKSEVAVCNVYGNTSSLIHNSLKNGNFDVYSDILGNKVTAWRKYGDVRSIFRLSGLVPQSPSKMAIISSGFGSMNDETTSCIYQTILVPESANTLTFSYDIVSEEPMEYVGSQFDDIFQVDILSTDGEILATLAYESVNTSTWYAVDGIDFPGGDETTYHTRWITVNTEAIAAYRGQLIVLRFTVQDTGDAIYDTAALIDSVSIS